MSWLSDIFGRSQNLSFTDAVDWHSHILPGVDDGVETIEESLEILQRYEQTGIKDVWLTPHIMEDIPNTTAMLRERFQLLQENYNGKISLHLASENMIDNLFRQRLADGDLLPIGQDGKTLLIETSYFNAPLKLTETIKEINAKGFFPLLAHPERYNYIDKIAAYRDLKELGILFQLNLMSLCGYYGPRVKSKALSLLSAGLYDCIGSDLHRSLHLDVIQSISLPKDLVASINRLNFFKS